MEPVSPLPAQGAVFFDPRDQGRFLRVSYHDELGVFVLSLWREETCLGTFRLAADESPRLMHTMVAALVGAGSIVVGTAPPPGEASGDRSVSATFDVPERRENA